MKKKEIFSSSKVSPEMLQDVLWETLQKTRNKQLNAVEANVIINSAKEICNIARLELQYKILNGEFDKGQKQLP